MPLLAWIKKTQPQYSLVLICRKGLGSAFKKLGLVDDFFEIEKGNSASYKKVLIEIKKYDIQNWVSPHSSFRSALMGWKVNAKNKIAFRKWATQFLFSKTYDYDKAWPEAIRLLHLWQDENTELKKNLLTLTNSAEWIEKSPKGNLKPPPDWANPHRFLDLKKVQALKSELRIQERYPEVNSIVLFPGSVWATKMWKKEKFAYLGNQLQKLNQKILIMGGPDEKELGAWVSDKVPGSKNLCGQSSILESLLILSNQKMIIGNDSSSSHMGALMGIPVVSFFGPTVLRFGYRPWGGQAKVFELEGLKCRPCGAHGPRFCPLGHHRCMNDLDIEPKDLEDFYLN